MIAWLVRTLRFGRRLVGSKLAVLPIDDTRIAAVYIEFQPMELLSEAMHVIVFRCPTQRVSGALLH